MSGVDVITLQIGQVVYWPASPTGIAQIVELRRRCVRLIYPFKHGRCGRLAQPIVPVEQVAECVRQAPLLFPMHNVFNRGCLPRSKEFQLLPPQPPPEKADRRKPGRWRRDKDVQHGRGRRA